MVEHRNDFCTHIITYYKIIELIKVEGFLA